ncbi:hypothetical protein MN116_008757 [Schistosoma mekongi]|uniref:Uncharacterized protein n=1 Tax=Schistosoma mekongi TaxID=38744 RepID=A0AAE1Z658_SCHME|nr:hypothetical protein MN116_008757 [Schistosoma mekongi]
MVGRGGIGVVTVQRARSTNQSYLYSTTPYSTYPVIAAAAVAAAATAYLHGTITTTTPPPPPPTTTTNNNNNSSSYISNSMLNYTYNIPKSIELHYTLTPTTQYHSINHLPESYYQHYCNSTLNTCIPNEYLPSYTYPLMYSKNYNMNTCCTLHSSYHNSVSMLNSNQLTTLHNTNDYLTKINLSQQKQQTVYYVTSTQTISTTSCRSENYARLPLNNNIPINSINQYNHSNKNVTSMLQSTTIMNQFKEESKLNRQPDSSSSSSSSSSTSCSSLSSSLLSTSTSLLTSSVVSSMYSQNLHAFIVDIQKTIEAWINYKDVIIYTSMPIMYSNDNYHINIMKLWSNRLLKQIINILNKLLSFKQIWIDYFKTWRCVFYSNESNVYNTNNNNNTINMNMDKAADDGGNLNNDDDDNNDNDKDVNDDKMEEYLWINELITQIEFYELLDNEKITINQFTNRTLPIPDTTQTILCSELTEEECQLLIMNALPTLAIMHICQSMHTYQDEETIVKEIELLIGSISNHHHHNHHHGIMMMNLDTCQTNSGLEQTSTDINELWHRNTLKINNINLLLLISSLLHESYTKPFELLKYIIHMMLVKHITNKFKQHQNKQVTIATTATAVPTTVTTTTTVTKRWTLFYRLSQRIFNLFQISNELLNIQILTLTKNQC